MRSDQRSGRGAQRRCLLLRSGIASVAVASLLAGCASRPHPAASNFSVPPAVSAPSVTMVDVEHGIAAVGVAPVGAGSFSAPPALWLSTDAVHWRDATPPGARELVSPGIYPMFDAASFINPNTGWVTTWNILNLGVTIYRTSDAGKTWSAIAGGGHGDHAGDAEWIQLINPTTAIRESVAATASNMALDITTNAGASWRTVYTGPPPTAATELARGPYELPVAFASAQHGFAATGIPSYEPQVPGGFFATDDGGIHWRRLTLPSLATSNCVQGTASANRCVSTLPTFDDATHAVLATESITGSQARVGFDTSSDGGKSWRTAANVEVSIASFPSTEDPQRFVSVATPTSANWWIVSSTHNAVTTRVSADAGDNWSSIASADPLGAPDGIEALDATHALLQTTITTSDGTTLALWTTTDAGRRWHRLLGS